MAAAGPAVLVPIALSLVLALAYLFLGRGSPLAARLATKVGSVLLLTAAAGLAGAPGLLVLALLLSATGDLALVFAGRTAFIAGLAAFLAAHLLFSAAILAACGWPTGPFAVWQWGLIALLGLGAAALLAAVWDGARGMHAPATAYAAAILAMALVAVTTGRPVLVAGAICFFVSDAVLSLETFRLAPGTRLRRLTAPVVWVTYFTAQLLLAQGILAASGAV